MPPKGSLARQQGSDGRAVAGQGLGLCSRSQPLGSHGFWPLRAGRVAVGLAFLESLSEERDLGCFFLGGRRWGTPYQPGRAGSQG